MNTFPAEVLKRWFKQERRDLPWRDNPSPYMVWVSEMMLQQTQVDVVIPYFYRWMERFPTIKDLAAASIDEVIKVWEGLGYYSRARYLHQGACFICDNFNGNLPDNYTDLKKIKGLGPYTLGAILSFAFHHKISAVDGNVIRVLTRYFNIDDDVSKPKTVQKIRQYAEDLLPDAEPWVVNEALIELGALTCSRKPKCEKCPLNTSCKGFLNGNAEHLPVKTVKMTTEYLYRAVAIIINKDHVLLRRGKPGEIMSDLHEFPYFDTKREGMESKELMMKIQQELELGVVNKKNLPVVSHSFTRYQVRLNPSIFESSSKREVLGFFWHPLTKIHELAFSSGHRRLIQHLINI